MDTILVVIAGLLATTTMIVVMDLIHRLKWANADMVRAIGSLYTRSYEMSWVPGLLIQYCAGLSFAFLYALLIGMAPVSTGGGIFIVSLLAGLVHGITVSLFLTILVAEYHPLREFRNAGVGVALAHVAGHVFYGGSLGIFFALTHAKQNYLTSMFPAMLAHQIGGAIGFGGMWFFLFGTPLIFAGYVGYLVLSARYRRIAHEADLATGHDEEQAEDIAS
jgi:hypothetical protein